MPVKIPFEVFHIEEDGFHAKLTVLINGKPAVFVLDTGASKTVMDQNTIGHFLEDAELVANDKASSGLGTNTMQSHTVVISDIRIGSLRIADYPVAVLDLHHVNTAYENLALERMTGVLGSDILVKYHALIDYRNCTLELFEE